MEYVLMGLLIAFAVFITVAVLLQKTKEDGLSSTIVGGSSETYYGKDKAGRKDKLLHKWTLIIGIVFAVLVLVIYIIQPDYAQTFKADAWKDITQYGELLG